MRGELIYEGATKACSVPSRWRVFEARDGRLRGQGRTRLWTAADSHLQCRIMAQQIVIDGVFPAAADGKHARADDLCQCVLHPGRIASVRQHGRHPRDNADLPLGRAQQQETGIR